LAISFSFAKRLPASTKLAPSRANANAIAQPMPIPPPVMNTTFPASHVTKFPTPASNKTSRHQNVVPPNAHDSSIPALKPANRRNQPAQAFVSVYLKLRANNLELLYAHQHHLLPHLQQLRRRHHRAQH